MSGLEYFGIGVGCLLVIALVAGFLINLPDIKRYLKIRSM